MWLLSIFLHNFSILFFFLLCYNESRKYFSRRRDLEVKMKKIKIGVMGAYRGTSMINYCKAADNAELVAICDKYEPALEKQKESCGTDGITYYTSFDEFIKHDMDAVVLANYATEHVPFALRCFEAGKHVFSEVLPCQTMAEAVQLVEAVEKSGLIYGYAENYCYMPATYEMRKLYREGKIGELEYAECEYIHNCENIWHSISYGDPDHWRNNMHAFFYCTHSLGPIIHMCGLRPVSVTGFESKHNERCLRVGRKGGEYGIEMVTLENGAHVKSIHGGLYKGSIWYSAYGSKGRMESAREDANDGKYRKIYVNADDYSGEYGDEKLEAYMPVLPDAERVGKIFGHGGSDYYSMWNFVEKILGNDEADLIDVYEAIDMGLCGMFAYRSALAGGIPMEIPNLRNKEVRKQYRYDTACTDPKVAGDMLQPTMSIGTPDIPEKVYKEMEKKYLEELKSDSNYVKAAFTQSSSTGKDMI